MMQRPGGLRLPTWLVILVVLLVVVGAPSGIVWAAYLSATAVPEPAPPAAATDPRELTIVSLGIKGADILPMAMRDGVLDPPDNPRMIGWWNESADVGQESGTTLLTSHKVTNGTGAFEHLVDITPGADIVVTGATGAFVYQVQEVRVLHKDQLAAEAPQLFAQDGPHRLVLVTCEDWDGTSFESNSLVVATPRIDLVTAPIP